MFKYSDLRRQKLKTLLTYVAAASLGVCAFMIVFPAFILDPQNLDWIFPPIVQGGFGHDVHTHYLGWYFLRHSPVSFPLGAIPGYVAPLPTYMAYTDSLPLLGYLFRCVSQWLPDDFQYFGPWILLCMVLQSVFSLRLLKRWIKDPICLCIAVVLMTFSPILIYRAGHAALMAHWLILWSFDLLAEFYFANLSQSSVRMPFWRPILLVSLSTLIQPYLAAMVAGICWGLPLTSFLMDRSGGKTHWFWPALKLFLNTLVLVLPMIVLLYVFGFFNGTSRAPGFHYFGTDFFSLFNNHGTSSFIPRFRIKAGLAEGYTWPGAGGWVFLIAILVPRVRSQISLSWRNPHVKAAVMVCGVMWFFALSERIHFATFWLVDMEWFWSPFAFVTSSLRTAGRMTWPGYYFLIFTAMAVTANLYSAKAARRIFIGAFILQALDLGPWIANSSLRAKIYERPRLVDPFWAADATQYAHIKMIPPVQDNGHCFRQKSDYIFEWVEFARYAAKHNMSINSGYLARYDELTSQAYCNAQWYEFLAGPLQKDSIYVLRRGYIDEPSTHGPDRLCREMDGNMICVAKD